MRSAKPTTAKYLFFTLFLPAFFGIAVVNAQENSPYSRYAAGELSQNRNILSRGMGGVATAYSESLSQIFGNSINLNNPAALGAISRTLFELGGEVDVRILKSNNSPEKFQSVNTNISYIQLGVPLSSDRMRLKGNGAGISFGLRPYSRIDYKISQDVTYSGTDTVNTLYEGNGGLNLANFSAGVKLKGLSLGFTAGYLFGNKQISTAKRFFYDTVAYYNSAREVNDQFSGLFLSTGLLYELKFDSAKSLRFGGIVNWQKNINATTNSLSRTIGYSAEGETYSIDTVSYISGTKGKLVLPAAYSAGVVYTSPHLILGADFDLTQWDNYRYFGKADEVKNNWTFRLGAQYFPATYRTSVRKYWSFVKYRAGFYYGPDYINLNNTQRPEYAATLGAGFPLTRVNSFDLVTLNSAIEIGGRGNKENVSVRENFVRFSFGISMSAKWFIQRKYD